MKNIQALWRALITRVASKSLTEGSQTRPLAAATFFVLAGPKDTNVNDVIPTGHLGLLREAICIARNAREKSQSQQEPCSSELEYP